MIHDSIYVTFMKYHNYRDEEQISSFQGLGMADGCGYQEVT